MSAPTDALSNANAASVALDELTAAIDRIERLVPRDQINTAAYDAGLLRALVGNLRVALKVSPLAAPLTAVVLGELESLNGLITLRDLVTLTDLSTDTLQRLAKEAGIAADEGRRLRRFTIAEAIQILNWGLEAGKSQGVIDGCQTALAQLFSRFGEKINRKLPQTDRKLPQAHHSRAARAYFVP